MSSPMVDGCENHRSAAFLFADYFAWRSCKLNLVALYHADGEYRFTNGFSIVALMALLVGVLPSLPGFQVQAKWLMPETVPPFFAQLYIYAWFIGFVVAFVVYLMGRSITRGVGDAACQAVK